ncbi:hypothetical protein KUTeg_010811 [Tegillarca granosa]|uniref:Centrosomal protein of 78 kDa n=1 Tax=Tegillarca granosa TaxID=220873 RepID=A0ABQ9F5I5_TEGGR|nr:hypothetical protein KUTeg_010811 [Tegillarca granosa]
MKRHNEAWRDSLRYRRPDLDRMPGIRRITINNNPMMGDQGASLLAEALKDDLWLKALDMQGTGISTTGARALLDVLKYNTTIVVLDVRRNPLIDRDVVHNIMEQLMINCNGQDTEYKWIKADDPIESNKKALAKKRRTKTLNSSFGRKTTIRITAGAARRRTKSTGSVGVSRKVQPISSEEVKAGPGLPWRTAARANRYRGYPPEHIPGMARLFENSEASPPSSPDQSASVIITKDDSLAEDDTLQELERMKLDDSGLLTGINKMNNIKDLRVEIVQLKRRLQEERIARTKAEERVVKSGGILDDDSVLDSIEASFKQFHEFLDLLRDAGLGQLITMAGLDRQGSPFAQQGKSTFPQKMSQFKSSSSIPPRPVKPNMKSNGYFGDISSSNWVSASHSSKEEEKPVKFGKFFDQESPNKFSYFSARDPTMDSHLNDSSQNGVPSKKDDLYDRIVNETSGAFPHILQNGNSENVLQMKSQLGAEKSYQKSDDMEKQDMEKVKKGLMEEDYSFEKSDIDQSESHSSKPIPQPRGRKLSAEDGVSDPKPYDQGKEDSKENILQMSEKESPEHKSKMSEVNYSMDSFEQSYLSERGEVIHLEGDFDIYGSTPSLPQQGIDSEENDF